MGQIGVPRWIAFDPQHKQACRRAAQGEIKCKGISYSRDTYLKALFTKIFGYALHEVPLGMSGTGRYTSATRPVETVEQRLRLVS